RDKQAVLTRNKLSERLTDWKLEIHPTKTRIIYCKDSGREGPYEPFSFPFLGYEFKPRRARNTQDGSIFTSYQPAISPTAEREIHEDIREWHLNRRTQATLN